METNLVHSDVLICINWKLFLFAVSEMLKCMDIFVEGTFGRQHSKELGVLCFIDFTMDVKAHRSHDMWDTR